MFILRRFLRALILLCGVVATSAYASDYVFRLDGQARHIHVLRNLDRTPVTFGLSGWQREMIFQITSGATNLRGLYKVSTPNELVQPELLPGYFGRLDATPIAPYARRVPGTNRYVANPVFGLETEAIDPLLKDEWWIKDLNVPDAWPLATGKGVIIADCDTGYYVDEPDLKGNLLTDLRRDFADKTHPLQVHDGGMVFHGTAVASIMAGVKDGKGTQGIAYDAKIVPLQNFNYDRSLDNVDKEEATARCVMHAISIDKVGVIVVSSQTAMGSSETFAGTREAVSLALLSGVAVVVAAGNGSRELTDELAHDTGSIMVGALRQGGKMQSYSNFGKRVNVSAFGEGLRTLYGPAGRVDSFGGTTGAAAQVAAAVALIRQVNPGLSPPRIRQVIEDTRRTFGDNGKVGGQLDVAAAVKRAKLELPDPTEVDAAGTFREILTSILRGGH